MSSIRFGRGREYQFFRREDIRGRWDLQSAVHFLNGFRADAVVMANLRRQLVATNSAKLTDEQVIQSVARMLVAGEFVVALPQGMPRRDTLDLGRETVVAPAAKRSSTPAEVRDDDPTFQSGHDGVAQAAVLLAAAREAYPFCEECARHAAMEMASQ